MRGAGTRGWARRRERRARDAADRSAFPARLRGLRCKPHSRGRLRPRAERTCICFLLSAASPVSWDSAAHASSSETPRTSCSPAAAASRLRASTGDAEGCCCCCCWCCLPPACCCCCCCCCCWSASAGAAAGAGAASGPAPRTHVTGAQVGQPACFPNQVHAQPDALLFEAQGRPGARIPAHPHLGRGAAAGRQACGAPEAGWPPQPSSWAAARRWRRPLRLRAGGLRRPHPRSGPRQQRTRRLRRALAYPRRACLGDSHASHDCVTCCCCCGCMLQGAPSCHVSTFF
jgi:hypothetical protein